MDIRQVIVAEIHFSRTARPEQFRRLGEALARCQTLFPWIATISNLNALLRGECPMSYSKAISLGQATELPFYDPILVWGRLDYPDKKQIDPVALLKEAVPAELGAVSYPDPDNGL